MNPIFKEYAQRLESLRTTWLFDETALTSFKDQEAEQHFLQAISFIELAQRAMTLAAMK